MQLRLCIFLFWVLPYVAQGQGFKFEASLSKGTVQVGEQFSLTYSANGKITSFSAPRFTNFRTLSGPNSSSSMNYVNGKVSRKEAYSYILMGQKVGTFTFPAATIKSGGNVYKSNPVTIKVVKATKKKKSAGVTSTNLFLEARPSKRSIYKGEQLPITYTVYFNLEVSHSETVKLPDLNGFWTEDVSVPRQASVYSTTIDNVRYNAADLMKKVIFPQRSGTLELGPMEFKVFVRTRTRRRSIFDSGYRDDEYILKSIPVKIKVKPLPDKGKPQSFDGAVGKYALKVNIDKSALQANEAVTLKVRLSGAGNLKLIEPLKLQLPPDIDTFDPKITNNLKVDMSGVSGSRTFEYLLIPRHAGEFVIPAIEFSYFDPAKGKYKTLKSEEFKLSVSKGDEQSTTTLSSINKENVKFIGSDIRFIKDAPFLLLDKGAVFFLSKAFYVAYASPALLLMLLLVLRRRHILRNKDIVQVRRRGAGKMAKKSLARAKALLNKDKAQFYQEVLKGLWGYLGMKLSVDTVDMSKEAIKAALSSKSVSDETIAIMISVLDQCEFAQYAPEGQGTDMGDVYAEAARVIEKIENEIG
ncbi:MAG: protein BatD [Flavobacteriales bacterium]|nr:protein BatD [Flavobacteriales bacterium]